MLWGDVTAPVEPSFELDRTIFLIDVLKKEFVFKVEGEKEKEQVGIYKCVPGGNRAVTRKELIYFMQIEFPDRWEKFKGPDGDYYTKTLRTQHMSKGRLVFNYYRRWFSTIDEINKSISNIFYLEKYLEEKKDEQDKKDKKDKKDKQDEEDEQEEYDEEEEQDEYDEEDEEEQAEQEEDGDL